MTATVDEGRPERAWGVAAVPVHRHTAEQSQQSDPPRLTPKRTGGQTLRHHRAPDAAPTGRLRTFLALAILLASAGFGGFLIIRQRLADQAFVELGSVVLTAEAVPVGFAEAVVVNQVNVRQHARVEVGQALATVTGALGRVQVLTAPVAGTVAAVKVGVGGVARGGEPIIMLYDQARLTFQAEVPLAQLRRMRLGMTTYIEGPGLSNQITTTLDHVIPVVGDAPSDRLTVVLMPDAKDRATVSTLVPGLQFAARVDTTTAPHAVPAVNAG
jgi:hypothetical protein